jgi:hypothetical protein
MIPDLSFYLNLKAAHSVTPQIVWQVEPATMTPMAAGTVCACEMAMGHLQTASELV